MIEDSIGPGEPDEIGTCASVAMERCDWRRKVHRETEQMLKNMLSEEAELYSLSVGLSINRSQDSTSESPSSPSTHPVSHRPLSTLKTGKIHVLLSTRTS